MSTLYRKYRPMNFAEVVGQNHIKITLSNEIQTGKLAHAYLFCGPRAVGKTTLARVFAKALNCTERKNDEFEPCDRCVSCLNINKGSNIDVTEIDAASNTGVDNVRENIIASSRVYSASSKYKVFIIDEVHMMSPSAFNALLKTLEEPPSDVIFILCTTEIQKVPSTIISRCQRFDFKRISVSDSVRKLTYIVSKEGVSIDKSILEDIARKSDGYQRDAESLLGQIVSISGSKITKDDADLVIPRNNINELITFVGHIASKDLVKSIRFINELSDSGVDLSVFSGALIEMLRRLVLAKVDQKLYDDLSLDLGESFESKINSIVSQFEIKQLILFIELANNARLELKNSHIQQLPLELLILKFIQYTEGSSLQKHLSKETTLAKTNDIQNNSVDQSPVSLNNENFSADRLKSSWHEFIANIKKYNHSISFVLTACNPVVADDGYLELIFKYKIHKDRVEDPQVVAIIAKALQETFGLAINFRSIFNDQIQILEATPLVVNESPSIEKKVDNELLNNILNTFGGKVVG